MMNGIELMEAIFLELPHLPVIVISAHEKFDFAKMSLRLGARDYLIKPVELDELIRVVGRVLREKKDAMRGAGRHDDPEQHVFSRRNEALMELVTEPNLQQQDYAELVQEAGAVFNGGGGHYGVVLVQLDVSKGGFSNRNVTLKDRKLLKYASLNIMEESLSDWGGFAFGGFGNRLVAVIQLNGQDAADARMQSNAQLHLIGQTIHLNLKQYANIAATVGMSTLHTDVARLPKLMEEAAAALEWSKIHPHNRVLLYEDMAGSHARNMMEWIGRVEEFVQRLKTAEGLPQPHELAAVARSLTDLGPSSELFKSCFGLLVYRLFGLLFEYGQEGGEPLHRFDPDVYFRGLTNEGKTGRLADYIRELAALLRRSMMERDQSIVSRVAGYIQKHYRNHGLKIQDIAGEVHFSASYVSYLFRQEMQKNIWDYVSEIRIEDAKRLLAMTDLKRYEIAYEVGYESPEHFSRMFKRYTGVSPADYRKERQGQGVSD
jgi:two-component system response regulator YesN